MTATTIDNDYTDDRDPIERMWRTGRKLGRTIYAVAEGNEDRLADTFIGIMDDPIVAEWVVQLHNCNVAWRRMHDAKP